MTQLLVKSVADFSTTLSLKTAIGATTATLTSATDSDGVSLPTGTYGFTVDRDSAAKEHFTATVTGTALTNIKTVTRGTGVGTAGLLREHRKGAEVIITDHVAIKRITDILDGTTGIDSATPLKYDASPTFTLATQLVDKNYVDGVVVAGGVDASTTVKGISKLSVAPVSATEPIAVGDNDTRIPTAAIVSALAGESGTAPASTNKFVDAQNIVGIISPYAGSASPTGWLLCDGSAVSRATYARLFAITSTNFGVGDGSTTFNLPDLRSRMPIGVGTGTKVATFSSRASNVITVTGLTNAANNEFQTGQAIVYHYATTAITGLVQDTTYYIIRVTNTSFSLATSLANAIAGTVITLSSDGSGVQTFTKTLTARTLAGTGGEETHALITAEIPSHTHSGGIPAMSGAGPYGYAGGNIFSSLNGGSIGATGGNTAHSVMNPFVGVNYIIKY